MRQLLKKSLTENFIIVQCIKERKKTIFFDIRIPLIIGFGII